LCAPDVRGRYVALHEEDDTQQINEDGTTTNPYKYRDAPGQSLKQQQQQKLPFTPTIRSICEKAESFGILLGATSPQALLNTAPSW
jgi:hypothetical protein